MNGEKMQNTTRETNNNHDDTQSEHGSGYDPEHPVNVALREIQEAKVREMTPLYGPELAEGFKVDEFWEGWKDVSQSQDVVGAFQERYGRFVAERIQQIEAQRMERD